MELLLQQVSHAYGPLSVLQDLSFTVRAGETLAVIGPSGCGKSTLLGMMGGLLRPSAGRIVMSGAPPADCLNPLTYVFQDFALLPWRSVAGNVRLPLEHQPLPRRERQRRVAETLALTGLTEFANAYPKQLSGGMRQRVGIARALVTDPAVLLMDEPLSALDAQTRELLMEELLAIWQRRRTTTVYVTHNLQEAIRLADRIALLSRRPGRLRQLTEVPVPRAERDSPQAAPLLAGLQEQLWRMIRDEARSADREMSDV